MEPLTIADLERIAAACNSTARRDVRDKAIIIVGFASALRRSSLSELNLADVEFVDQGAVLHIRREKQDQQGNGRMIGLPPSEKKAVCPVEALRAWIALRGNWAGSLFTSLQFPRHRLRAESIANIIKRRAKAIGLDPSRYAGHSLRAGFVTEAGERGIGDLLIASQTGHRSLRTIRRYFRRRDVFKANAAGMIGL